MSRRPGPLAPARDVAPSSTRRGEADPAVGPAPPCSGERTIAALGPALEQVRRNGFARVASALPAAWRDELVEETDGHPFLALPEKVGRVRQEAEELVLEADDGRLPAMVALARALHRSVRAGAPASAGLSSFTPLQATYMRYRGGTAGVSPHLDGKCYSLLVCIFTLRGEASFSVLADRAGTQVLARWTTAPGDLCLLRGPGFGGTEDGRPLHSVGPPRGGDRTSLTFRMNARCPSPGQLTTSD